WRAGSMRVGEADVWAVNGLVDQVNLAHRRVVVGTRDGEVRRPVLPVPEGPSPGNGCRAGAAIYQLTAHATFIGNDAENSTAAMPACGLGRKCWFVGLLGSFGLLTLA